MPIGSLNLTTSKRPASRADMHFAMMMPCFLLMMLCGLFGIGLVTNYITEMKHEITHYKSICYVLNFTALREPCKGACWKPAWTVNLTMSDGFAVVNVTEQPNRFTSSKYEEALEESMKRETLNTTVTCWYDPLTFNVTTRFTAPDPGSARAKVGAIYFFACLGAFSIILIILNCIIRPTCFEPAVKAYTADQGDQSCWPSRSKSKVVEVDLSTEKKQQGSLEIL